MDDSETYMNLPHVKPDPPSSSRSERGRDGASHELGLKENIGRRPRLQICLLCLVASLIVTVAGLSIHEKTCSGDWVTNKDRCYYVSAFETYLYKAIQECSSRDSKLLEINSREESSFVTRRLVDRNRLYWIGKCEYRTVSFRLLYKESFETSVCSQCDPTAVRMSYPCDRDQRFICEKPTPLIQDIPEKIQGLCQ